MGILSIKASNQPTYHFHEITRGLVNPSRHYGDVQWVFSPPVHCLPTHDKPVQATKNLQKQDLS